MANQSRPMDAASFVAGTRTKVSAFRAFAIGIFVAIVIYAVAWFFKGSDRHPGLMWEYLANRGYVQYFSTVAFGWAIGFFWLKIDLIRSQRSAFGVVQQKVFSSFSQESKVTTTTAETIRRALQALPPGVRRSMLVNRLENACRRLINIRSAAEVDNIFQMLSEQDAAHIESSYTVVKFLFALIPLLGFIGNVLGVGNGIGAFAGALGGSTQTFQELKPVLQFASLKLASAFDTTFLALAYSGVILAVNAVMQQSEENLLAAVDEYCLEHFVSRIEVQSSDISDLKTHLSELHKDLKGHLANLTSNVNVAIENGTGGIETVISAFAQSDFNDASKKHFDALNRIEGVVAGLGSGGTALDSIRESVSALYQLMEERTSEDNSATLLADKLDAIRQQLQSTNGSQKGPDLEALGASLEKLSERLGTLDHAAAAFSGVEGLFVELREALEALKPAIDSMSAEMAKEVNQVLGMLLRVMVVAHRMDRLTPEERKALTQPDLLARTFGPTVDGHN